MPQGFFLRIKGDVWIKVPSPAQFLTTYVLLEQEDWFEKEIRFVRRMLKPGMHVVDVGANFGVYSLAAAKLVGSNGRVSSYEPLHATGDFLKASALKNQFSNLNVVTAALSDHAGFARFYTYPNTEMNSLTRVEASDGAVVQDVPLSTLDNEYARLDWSTVDFLKIDAEGEEQKILRGGLRLLDQCSPLIMFEVKGRDSAGATRGVTEVLRGLGYVIFRLIGPDTMLAPVPDADLDKVDELNLFACKSDRATKLAADSLLAFGRGGRSEGVSGAGLTLFNRQLYARGFGTMNVRDKAYEQALDAYARWRDVGVSIEERYASLTAAVAALREAAGRSPTLPRLSSLARSALEAGDKIVAVDAINACIRRLVDEAPPPPDEPFFPPEPRYDAIEQFGNPRAWLLAATVEAAERVGAYSRYFQTPTAKLLQLHEWLLSTPFATPEMERRRQLLRIRTGQQVRAAPVALLATVSDDNLNAELWANDMVSWD